jgi:hypothetical protein
LVFAIVDDFFEVIDFDFEVLNGFFDIIDFIDGFIEEIVLCIVFVFELVVLVEAQLVVVFDIGFVDVDVFLGVRHASLSRLSASLHRSHDLDQLAIEGDDSVSRGAIGDLHRVFDGVGDERVSHREIKGVFQFGIGVSYQIKQSLTVLSRQLKVSLLNVLDPCYFF